MEEILDAVIIDYPMAFSNQKVLVMVTKLNIGHRDPSKILDRYELVYAMRIE